MRIFYFQFLLLSNMKIVEERRLLYFLEKDDESNFYSERVELEGTIAWHGHFHLNLYEENKS